MWQPGPSEPLTNSWRIAAGPADRAPDRRCGTRSPRQGTAAYDSSTATHGCEEGGFARRSRICLPPTPFPCGDSARRFSSDGASLAPGRHHLRIKHVGFRGETDIRIFSDAGELDLEPEISIIAERAQALTGATGAAIALRKGDEIVCRARTGRTAPDLGVRLEINSGLSAECVRTGEVLLCEDAETNPCVDLASCRRLGVRSILVAPLRHFRKTLGVFEVLSSVPYAFDHGDVTTMQFLASMMVAAISRLSSLRLARD